MDGMNINEFTEEPGTTPPCSGTGIVTETCPEPVNVYLDGCEDSVEFHAGNLGLDSLGRILKLDVTLRDVCPHRRVALAVVLTELDREGHEYRRGLKTLLIPAQDCDRCRDITVRCVKFVLPEELDVSGSSDALCNRRNFRVRFLANYVDSGFDCCSLTL